MPGWDRTPALLRDELVQAREEGRDPAILDAIGKDLEAAGTDEARLAPFWVRLAGVPPAKDFPFQEPDEIEAIRALRAAGPRRIPVKDGEERLLDRLHGAWLGRCAGCALGKPVEGFMDPSTCPVLLSSRERIKAYLQAAGPREYPLNQYFPERSPAEGRTGRAICPGSCRERIAFAESDDDLRYTVIAQILLRRRGPKFTTADIAREWLEHLPYRSVFTAEAMAYRNLLLRYEFHRGAARDEEVDWRWVATNQNPYREWIGAQIRADSWGYAVPGWPERAAELAWRDARLSHARNGIYGEMFAAAAVAAALALDDPLAAVEAGLAEIPRTSRLHAAIRETLDICRTAGGRSDAFEKVHDAIYRRLGGYSPAHTINNAALVAAALALGGRDFEKTITIAVMGGWDTDCNGATSGSILGAVLGASRLPPKWTAPLNDTLKAQITDYHPISIRECARRSLEIVKRMA